MPTSDTKLSPMEGDRSPFSPGYATVWGRFLSARISHSFRMRKLKGISNFNVPSLGDWLSVKSFIQPIEYVILRENTPMFLKHSRVMML